MAGQMQPDNEHGLTSLQQNSDGTEHPTDDLLLAYVNHQYLNNRIEIQQHILRCQTCQQTCLAFEQAGMLITSGIQEHQAAQAYPSIANSVLERIEREHAQSWGSHVAGLAQAAYTSSKSVVERAIGTGRASKTTTPLSPVPGSQFKQPGAFVSRQTSSQIPAVQMPGRRVAKARPGITGLWLANNAAVLLIVLLATFGIAIAAIAAVPSWHLGVWGAPPTTIPVQPHSAPPTTSITPTVALTGTARPVSTVTPTPTQQPKTTATPTPGPTSTPTSVATPTPGSGSGTPMIQLCSTKSDIQKWIVRLCGSGFNPGDRLQLYIPANTHGRPVSQNADAQGNLHYSFTIGSNCKYVPKSILVRDTAYAGSGLTLRNIVYGSC